VKGNRRQFITRSAAGAAGLAASSLAGVSGAEGGRQRTFVLVHGTWHGGWVWRDVRRRLRAAGHLVFTPTCTGCGEREHLSNPGVGLDTHIQDIVNVIEYEELDDVVLVGHSFAGMTITGVADKLKDRIRHIVFFDALVPRAGRMAAVPRDPATGELPGWFRERQKKFIDGYRMVLWEDYPVEMLVPPQETGIVNRLERLITTHPARQWTDELTLHRGGWEGLPRSYIHCVGQRYRMSSEAMVGPARGPGWNFIELDIPRDGMLTHPELVTDTLVQLSGQKPAGP
jgi:pimeloyl-ACP methyl ester carboxylesterase